MRLRLRLRPSSCVPAHSVDWVSNTGKYALIVLLSSFDFYLSGVRVFDLFSYALIIVSAALFVKFKRLTVFDTTLIFTFGVYALIGATSGGGALSAAAIFINCILFFVFYRGEFGFEEKHVRFALKFHLFFFILQFASYYALSDVMNFHKFTDIDPRLESTLFRPAGLFYEPAMYCLNVLMLLILLPVGRSKLLLLEIIAILTMIFSLSLLGLVFAGMALFRLVINRKYALVGFGSMLVASVYYFVDDVYLDFIFNRVSDLESDASAQGRYQGLALIFSWPNAIYGIFGRGFGADFERFGSSGMSAAISYVGLFGVVALVSGFLWRGGDRLTRLLTLIAISISAPVFSYAILPFWIAGIVKLSDWRAVRSKAAPVP